MLSALLISAVLASASANCAPSGMIEPYAAGTDFTAYPLGSLISVPSDFELHTPDAINFGPSDRIAEPKRYLLVARRSAEGACIQDRGMGCTGTMQPGDSIAMNEIAHDLSRCLILYEFGRPKPESSETRTDKNLFSLVVPGLLLLIIVRAFVTLKRWQHYRPVWKMARAAVFADVLAASAFGLYFTASILGTSPRESDSYVVLALNLLPALLLSLPLLSLRMWPFAISLCVCVAALGGGIFNTGMSWAWPWLFAFGFTVLSAVIVGATLLARRTVQGRRPPTSPSN